jgi:hypothetical protein
LIDSWSVVKEGKDGRMVAVEVVLSEWFYNSVLGNAVLSLLNITTSPFIEMLYSGRWFVSANLFMLKRNLFSGEFEPILSLSLSSPIFQTI